MAGEETTSPSVSNSQRTVKGFLASAFGLGSRVSPLEVGLGWGVAVAGLDFGRGSSAFQQGDLETAKHSFEQSLKADDEQLKSKAMYNLGNTFYQNQKTEEALAFYRKALELDPTDKEAKYNYEFLK